MSETDKINQLQKQLAQHYSLLVSQLAAQASEEAIAATRQAIVECKDALRYYGIVVDEEHELATARQHHQTIGGYAVVGIAVAGDVNAPISQQTTIHIPKRPPIDPEEAKRRLAELPEDAIPAVADLPIGSRVESLRTSNFVGREEDLLTLAKQLKQGGVSLITTGIGGVGKSTLASEFAYRYGHYFLGGVYWLSFADTAAIEGEIAACGGYDAMQVYHESEQLSLQERCARVQAAWQEPTPRLLIFDNWDQVSEQRSRQLLERYLPKGGGCRVLITSRNSQWPSDRALHVVALGVLSRAESITLLRSYRADLSESDADAIAEELGDLPLALSLAGRFLASYQESSVGAPQTYLSNLRKKLLDHRSLNPEERGVRATFAMSYEQLQPDQEIDALAIAALARAACFAANEPIPQALLEYSLGEVDPEDEDQALLRADAIKRLLQLGLVEQAGDGAVRIHRLIAEYAQQTINNPDAQAQVERIVIAITHHLVNQGRPAQLLPLMPHLRHCYQVHDGLENLRSGELAFALGRAEQEQINYRAAEPLYQQALTIHQEQLGIKHPDTATSLNNLAYLYNAQGRYTEAEPLYQQALTIHQEQLGINHPDTATSLNNLAGLYEKQGRYTEAEPLFQQALTITQEQLGINHPNTASSLNNLAGLYESQGRYTEAEPLYQQALTIHQEQLSIKHPDTATSLNNLAGLYEKQGRYTEAEPLFQQALTIYQEQLGINHPSTATSLNNLAGLYEKQGRYTEAEPLYQQALTIRTEQLGITHPDTATSLNNLALLYKSQGRYTEAEPLYQQALTIRTEQLGIKHPDTATSLNNLALLYKSQGRYTEAEPLYQQALTITQEQLGTNHPDTATSLNNLAGLYESQGQYTEAERLYQQALTIYQEQLGITHPSTATSLNNLASLYDSQGRYTEAEPLYQQALTIRTEQLGFNHPDTATSIGNLAGLYYAQGRYTEAEPLFQQALTIRTEQLGFNHPDTATSLNNLAGLYESQGRYTEAEPLYQQTLTIYQEHLGINHPDTATSLNNLAGLYRTQGRYTEAEPLYQQALSIRERVLGAEHPSTKSVHNGLVLCQRLGSELTRAKAAVEQALAHPQIDRAALAQQLEKAAQHSEAGEEAGSPWLVLAAQLRALIERLDLANYTPPSLEQKIASHLSNAKKAVEEALNDPQIDRSALAQQLEQNAQQAEAGEEEGSPWLVFAIQLRSLIERLDLANYTPPTMEDQIATVLAQAEQLVTEALNDSAIDRPALIQQLQEAAHYYEEGEEQGSPWLVLATQLRELIPKLQTTPEA
jgi:tetratricopeptide (TPR) repeat protein